MTLEYLVSDEELYYNLRKPLNFKMLNICHMLNVGLFRSIPKNKESKRISKKDISLERMALEAKYHVDNYLGSDIVRLPDVKWRSIIKPSSANEKRILKLYGLSSLSLAGGIVCAATGVLIPIIPTITLSAMIAYHAHEQNKLTGESRITTNLKTKEQKIIIPKKRTKEYVMQSLIHEYAHTVFHYFNDSISLKKGYSAVSEGFARIVELEICLRIASKTQNRSIMKNVYGRIAGDTYCALKGLRQDIMTGTGFSRTNIRKICSGDISHAIGTSAFIVARGIEPSVEKKILQKDYSAFAT